MSAGQPVRAECVARHGLRFLVTQGRPPFLHGPDPLLGVQLEVAVGDQAGCLIVSPPPLADRRTADGSAELRELVKEHDAVVRESARMYPERA